MHDAATIEVNITPTQIATVRAVAADLAARADFDLDAVADLRMAVDEACSTLATLAQPGSRLHCTLRVDPDRITVTARILAPHRSTISANTFGISENTNRISANTFGISQNNFGISQNTFGWRVLVTLADEVEIIAEPYSDGSAASSLGIRLVKMRQGTTV